MTNTPTPTPKQTPEGRWLTEQEVCDLNAQDAQCGGYRFHRPIITRLCRLLDEKEFRATTAEAALARVAAERDELLEDMRDIHEYWNGSDEAAPDAAMHAQDIAHAILARSKPQPPTPGKETVYEP